MKGRQDDHACDCGVCCCRRTCVFAGNRWFETRRPFGSYVQGLAGKAGNGVEGVADAGVGVSGSSKSNDGIVGTSGGDRRSGVFGDHTDTIRVTFGVSGRCQSPKGAGVFGFSDFGYGGQFSGMRAPLRLQPGTTVGRPTTGNHQAGEFFVDENGDLFFCKLGGTPGTWFLVLLGA